MAVTFRVSVWSKIKNNFFLPDYFLALPDSCVGEKSGSKKIQPRDWSQEVVVSYLEFWQV
jgi:hypothetical protein